MRFNDSSLTEDDYAKNSEYIVEYLFLQLIVTSFEKYCERDKLAEKSAGTDMTS